MSVGVEKITESASIIELNVRSWIRYFITRWKFLILALIIGACSGGIYLSFQKKQYKAVYRFVVEDEKSNGGLSGALGIASQFGFDLGGNSNSIFSSTNIIELIKSRTLVQMALLEEYDSAKRQLMIDKYLEDNELPIKKRVPAGFNKIANSKFKDTVLSTICQVLQSKNIIVSQTDKKNSIIDLSVKSYSSEFSKRMAEALMRIASEYYTEVKTKKSQNNLNILKKQADSVRKELYSALTGTATSIDHTFNLNQALNVERVPTQKRQIDIQTNSAILTELVKNLELAKVTLRNDTPLFQYIETPQLPLQVIGTSRILVLAGTSILFLLLTMILLAIKKVFLN